MSSQLFDDKRGRANANLLAHACELLASMERAFDLLEGIADKLLYEEDSRSRRLNPANRGDLQRCDSELAPFETLIRKARAKHDAAQPGYARSYLRGESLPGGFGSADGSCRLRRTPAAGRGSVVAPFL